MNANRDEAIKCISIAQRYLDESNYTSARKFVEKSLNLYPTPEAKQLSEQISVRETEPASSSSEQQSSTYTSGARSHASETSAHKRHANTPTNQAQSSTERKRHFTPEQVAVVKRIQKCKSTDYYEIMGLQKDCTEADVKKAYRKLALQLHPDKNGAPGADEAFKLVSKAFQILSDPQKREIFDQHGDDPDSRFSGMQSSFARANAGGTAFGEEISPEELFNMFFGGGGGGFGGGFGGGGPIFTAQFGPGGFATNRMGGMRGFQRHRQAAGQQQNTNNWLQFIPFLFIFVLPLISNLFSFLFSAPTVPDPPYSYSETTKFSSARYTTPHKVPYYVHEDSFSKHPIYESLPQQARGSAQAGTFVSRGSPLMKFETHIEERFANHYYDDCAREHQRKQREIEREQGFFGFGSDPAKIKKIEERRIESCDILKQYGFIS